MAHIRSILPQRGGVSPVDSNTVALFHYDEHVNDSLKGLKPIGNQYSLYLNGGANVSISNPPDITLTNKITVMGWFKSIGTPGNSYHILFSQDASEVEISIDSSGYIRTGLVLNGTRQVNNSGSGLLDGVWHHLAMTYDGATMIAYIDGVQTGSWSLTGTLSKGTNWMIGQYGAGSTYYSNAYHADIKVWNRALSAYEIKNTMNSVFDNDSLLGYWKLDENSGTIAYDYSKQGNDGIITSGTWVRGVSVYSLINGGYPGGNGKGVLLEEATTNLIPYPTDFTKTTTAVGWDARDNVTLTYNEPDPLGENGAVKIHPNSTTDNYFGIRKPLAAGTYSYSVWLKSSVAGKVITVIVGGPTNGTDGIKNTATLTTSWQKFTFTGTYTTNANYTFHVGGWSNWADNSFDVWMFQPQVEAKTFPTSFVNGTRNISNLRYPSSIISGNTQGTISFWYKPLYMSANYEVLMRCGNWGTGANGWGILKQSGDTYPYFEIGIPGTNAVSAIASSARFEVNKWYYIAATWGASGIALYVFGENGLIQKATGGAMNLALNYLYPIGVGKNPNDDNYQVNAIFDELRIDNIARTDTEIAAWYYQGRNGW